MDFSKICIVGFGYIGLPTATVIASSKWNVIGLDFSPNVLDIINKGEIHTIKPDLNKINFVASARA